MADRHDLIEAIQIELQTMNPARLDKVLGYARLQNSEQASYIHELRDKPAPKPKAKRQRKTGTFREVRTIRNRSGGQTYQWAYNVTYEDGKRIKSKSIGRVE